MNTNVGLEIKLFHLPAKNKGNSFHKLPFERNGSLRYVASHGYPAYNWRPSTQSNSSPALDVDDVSPPQCDAVPGRDVEENAAKAPEMGRFFRGNFEEIHRGFHVAVSLGCFPFFGIMKLLGFVRWKMFTAFTKVWPSRTCRHLILEHLIVLFYKSIFSRCLKGWCLCHVDENSHDPICQQSNNQQVIHQRSIFFHDNIFTQENNGLVRTTLTSLLICSSFGREDDHPLLICSSRQEQPQFIIFILSSSRRHGNLGEIFGDVAIWFKWWNLWGLSPASL